MFKLMDKKIITILRNFLCLTGPMRVVDVKITCLLSLQNKSVISVLSMFCYFFSNDLLVLHSASESQTPPKLVIGIKKTDASWLWSQI